MKNLRRGKFTTNKRRKHGFGVQLLFIVCLILAGFAGDTIEIKNKAANGFDYVKLEIDQYSKAEAKEEIASDIITTYTNTEEYPTDDIEENSASVSDESYIVKPQEENTYWAGADGHEITLLNNVYATDPSYTELIAFLKSDKTDEIEYNYQTFVCADFAETVHNNAETAGYNCAWVVLDFEEGEGHACNAFNTTDRGLIFVDCTNGLGYESIGNWDKIVNIEIGKNYIPRSIFNSRVRYFSMGTVSDYKIYW